MTSALITGITGQDGAYLAKFLLSKGYRVVGTYRGGAAQDFWRIKDLGIEKDPNLRVTACDLTDLREVVRLVESTAPLELYNLAGQSSLGPSLAHPTVAAHITGIGPLNLLEAIRVVNPAIRFFQASSAEMFGRGAKRPLTESAEFRPLNPYAVAKIFAHWMTITYRENYGVFGCSGILFNHESPLRGREFVTRKISQSMARIRLGLQEILELGYMDSQRDWGFAGEFVEGMWRMLQADISDTYVLATNRMTTVREFVYLSAQAAGFDLQWRGAGENEVAIDRNSGRTLVRVNPEFYRPSEIDLRIGNPEKAARDLGWVPKTTIAELCGMMVEADIRRIERGGVHA